MSNTAPEGSVPSAASASAEPGFARREPARQGTREDVGVVVVTLNAMPWLERCLESVRGHDTVVVDHGSTDGTPAHARSLPHVRVVEQPNRGLGAGWNRGMRELTGKRYFLILNADAWVVGDAVERLAAFADERPRAAYVGPRLLNPDGTLQRSVRAFPTVWRLVTEYYFLRKLAPGSRALNAFYAGRFRHDEVREADWLMGACMLVRTEAVEEVGGLDEDFFLFNEESDWCFRFRRAGWEVVFFPGAEVAHVGAAAHGGRMFREQVTSHLRFLAKHRGLRDAERARRLLAFALHIRALLFRGERGRMYADAARWLSSRRVPALLGR
jgi:N-acetylglucosaminyl-diphospho-decaprenol L-rhamnosyltransferase